MRVVVTDVHMSFWSMVEFMVKLAFATIPAAIIITMVVLGMIAIAERLASFSAALTGPTEEAATVRLFFTPK